MRAAYYGGTALTGAGQAIGLFEFAPYNLSDVQAYFSTINQPLNVPIVNVVLDGISPICGTCDDGEQVIDIQQAISMAPGAAAIIVYEGNNDTDMLNQMAVDNVAKQLSCSWGWLPADPKSDEPIFREFAAQGQNLFVASGDSGAYTPPSCTSNMQPGVLPGGRSLHHRRRRHAHHHQWARRPLGIGDCLGWKSPPRLRQYHGRQQRRI